MRVEASILGSCGRDSKILGREGSWGVAEGGEGVVEGLEILLGV